MDPGSEVAEAVPTPKKGENLALMAAMKRSNVASAVIYLCFAAEM